MFTTISNPYRPWPTVWGMGIITGALGLMCCFQMFWPLVLKLQTPVPDIKTSQAIRLTKPPRHVVADARGRKGKPVAAAEAAEKDAQSPSASAVPGTLQWRRHVERGHSLDFEIIAEQSLPVLRAFGVLLAMDVHRPRGKTLLYNLQNGSLRHGAVADDAVVREVEGLPAEFDGPLREAERELGARPRVWALYSDDLYSALRSLTEDTLQHQAVSIDSVKTVRVRLSLAGGRAFAVKLVSHS